ncbi:MAG: FAD binding domain-containing protein [Dehalococcoidales bacterium]|nr:FAD binding domain-containing protein [Dehalococcoidales bacterium]
MKKFAFKNTESVADAASLLKSGKAAVLAGGTDILNLLKAEAFGKSPELLVNIKNIRGLDTISEDSGGLTIGALTRLNAIASSEIIKAKYPALAEAAGSIAAPAIRNMATIAGNLCQEVQCWYFRRSFLTGNTFNCLRKGGKQCYAVSGDNRYHSIFKGNGCFAVCPSDIAVVLTALNTTIITSKRSIPIGDFFEPLGNILDSDEIITSIKVPDTPPGTRQNFLKFTLRPALDFSIASAAAIITTNDDTVTDSRIVLGAVAPIPYKAAYAEDSLKGKTIDESTAEKAAEEAVRDASPLSKNKYKIQIAKTLVKRAVLASSPSAVD